MKIFKIQEEDLYFVEKIHDSIKADWIFSAIEAYPLNHEESPEFTLGAELEEEDLPEVVKDMLKALVSAITEYHKQFIKEVSDMDKEDGLTDPEMSGDSNGASREYKELKATVFFNEYEFPYSVEHQETMSGTHFRFLKNHTMKYSEKDFNEGEIITVSRMGAGAMIIATRSKSSLTNEAEINELVDQGVLEETDETEDANPDSIISRFMSLFK